MKTVLVPGAPWPQIEVKKIEKPKAPPKPRKKRIRKPKLAIPGGMLDFFAEARHQIATGAARRKKKQTQGR